MITEYNNKQGTKEYGIRINARKTKFTRVNNTEKMKALAKEGKM